MNLLAILFGIVTCVVQMFLFWINVKYFNSLKRFISTSLGYSSTIAVTALYRCSSEEKKCICNIVINFWFFYLSLCIEHPQEESKIPL